MVHSKFTKELSEKKAEDSLAQSKAQKVLSEKKDEDSLANPKVMELEMDESKVKGVASLFPAQHFVGTSAGELKDREEVGWHLVRSRRRNRGALRRPSSGASHPSDEFILPRLLKCFRCLGRGHYASDCRDPPRCWTCKKMGHRSFVCKSITRGPSSSGGPARLSGRLPPLTPTCRVEVERSPEILDRVGQKRSCKLGWWVGDAEFVHLGPSTLTMEGYSLRSGLEVRLEQVLGQASFLGRQRTHPFGEEAGHRGR
ncbi:hypothetical protein QJS10_CPA06g01494 [Acorus calamus]|uniref:CCHC-type domain-containing protein n=1 Tax=Acorus calamus TaxID=4465 RepID=A0AAV9EPC2_ACOCL|nr:hypothetical protein QJS10_CPA06g01494 [Acorus calamus]